MITIKITVSDDVTDIPTTIECQFPELDKGTTWIDLEDRIKDVLRGLGFVIGYEEEAPSCPYDGCPYDEIDEECPFGGVLTCKQCKYGSCEGCALQEEEDDDCTTCEHKTSDGECEEECEDKVTEL